VLARPIRIAASLACLFVVLGFGAFAFDQARGASEESVNGIKGDPATFSDPSPDQERARQKQHSTVREGIDDVNDVLLRPFADLVDSDNAWVNHGIPTLLALLIYGFGLGLLANMLPKQRHHGGDWRTAG
jgi:hypothetical protein